MTTKPNLIGIAGYARAGKDTVGAYLTEHHGYERRAFADKLRELAYECNPQMAYGDMGGYVRYAESIDALGYEGAKDRYSEVRNFLVNLGAGARKVLGGDVWLDACLPTWCPPVVPTVVTDVRYPNEANRILYLGGEVWYVKRSGVGPANPEEERSILEVLNLPYVQTVYNSGTLADLVTQIEWTLL